MNRPAFIGSVVLALAALTTTMANDTVPLNELLEPQEHTYKTVGKQELKVFVFPPLAAGEAAADAAAPGVIFIHGGGWGSGQPSLFYPHCRYFARRGAVGIAIGYRLTAQAGITVGDCLTDCRDAVIWIRANAAKLHVDPAKLALAGDSAGGHLAAAVVLIPPGPDALPPVVAALCLFNPVLDIPALKWGASVAAGETRKDLPLADPQHRAHQLSPMFHVRAGLPPTLLMHGTADDCVLIEQADRFARLLGAAGNRCEYVRLDGIKHAFIVPGYGDDPTLVESLRTMDRFLAGLGLLQGPPTLALPAK